MRRWIMNWEMMKDCYVVAILFRTTLNLRYN